MVREGNNYSLYQVVSIDKQFNIRIAIIIILLMIMIGLLLIAKNSIEIIDQYKIYQQYEAQLLALQKQEEDKQVEIEKRKQVIEQTKKIELTQDGRDKIANIYHSDTKRAFLTFDDGPSIVTSTILDILKQEKIKASFFVLGSRVNAMPEMVKRIYEEGHYIANHGYSHSYSSIYSSPQAVLDEYNQCNDAVKNAIGQPEYNSHLFRFPGGLPGGRYANIKNQANELLSQNDIVHIDWNALSGDAETTTPTIEYEMERIQQTVADKNSVVILMHDAEAKRVTAEALPHIIHWLRENGYEFKNFYEMMK